MASGGHILQQQRDNVVTQLKTLLNDALKEICRANGKPVSGNKAELQKRCIAIVDDIVARGDPDAFETFRYRVTHKGQAPPLSGFAPAMNAHSSPASGHGHAPMASARGNAPASHHRLGASIRSFKSSPFYEIVDTVVPLQDLPEMPQNRNTVRTSINLSVEQAQRMAANPDMRLMMYCGMAQNMSAFSSVEIAFPNQIEVKVNDDDVKSNFKGLKNKPGSTKPADLTSKVRAKANYPNQLTVTYALTTKRYAFVVYMVKYVSASVLTERIRSGSVIPKDRVLEEMRKANADPDIEAVATRMSLKDPVSTVRITLPVRSIVCTHIQCFDGAMFMQLVEQAPLWNCPVCNKTVSFQSLCVDKYFEDILNKTPKNVEKVDVEPDGEWRVIKDDEDETAAGGVGKARASYDDDFDDDLVEVTDPTNKLINGLKQESQMHNFLSPNGSSSFAVNTPPLSSREASVAQSTASTHRVGSKRPSGAVIDLTLSDEDDEPPRPAKRHHTSARTATAATMTTTTTAQNQGNQHNPVPSYRTPASIPDLSRYQRPSVSATPTMQNHGYRQADAYRLSATADQIGSAQDTTTASLSPQQTYRQMYQGMNRTATPTIPPSNPQSPFAAPTQTYSMFAVANGNKPPAPPWPPLERTPSMSSAAGGTHAFAIRPPPSPLGYTESPQGHQYDGFGTGIGYASAQQYPQQNGTNSDTMWGWRSDRSNYSNSPA